MASIEKEINQTKSFGDIRIKAFINVVFTYNFLLKENKFLQKKFDSSIQQFNVLKIIKGKHPEPINPGKIKEVMFEKAPDLTRLIDRLVKKGLVKRWKSEDNRRQININLTEKGLELVEEMAPQVANHFMEKFSNLNDEEAEQLSNLLDKIRY